MFCSDGVLGALLLRLRLSMFCLLFGLISVVWIPCKVHGRESKELLVNGGNKNEGVLSWDGEVGDILSVCFITSFLSFLFFSSLFFLMSREGGLRKTYLASRDSFSIESPPPSSLK